MITGFFREVVVVGLGGFFGCVARYSIGCVVARLIPGASFPFGTFIANMTGCFLLGLIISSPLVSTGGFNRALLVTGLLGGFTTFSSFQLEALELLNGGSFVLAFGYVFGSVIGGLSLVWLGMRLTF